MVTWQNADDLAEIFKNANYAATNAVNVSRANNEADDLAFRKAQFAWKQTLDRAGLTGMFEGAATLPAMQSYAQMFGDWSTPEAGKKTLAAQQQEFSQARETAEMTGQWNGQSTMAGQKQAADIAAQRAGLTGYLDGSQTLAGQQQGWQQGFSEQQQADKNRQDYLSMLSGLRGPADYGQYLKVLGSTPNGLRDLVGAAAGQYVPASGATSGVGPVPVSMGSFMNSAATGMSQNYAPGQAPGYNPGQYAYPQSAPQNYPQTGYPGAPGNSEYERAYAQGAGQLQGQAGQFAGQQVTNTQPGTQMQGWDTGYQDRLGAMRQTMAGGGAPVNTDPAWTAEQLQAANAQQGQVPGQTAYQQAWGSNRSVAGSGLNQGAQQGQAAYGYGAPAGQQSQGTGYDEYMATARRLPPPNQIAPQAYNAMTSTQKQMYGGMYEQLGYNPQDVTDLYKQSLPKYARQGAQAGGIRMA